MNRAPDNQIDWDAIQKQYRLGTASNTQIASQFGTSVSAIGRKAVKEGWIADKAEEVQIATNSLLILQATNKASKLATPTPADIQVAAQVAVNVVLSHRGDISRGRKLMLALLSEVEITSQNKELFEKLGEILDDSGPDANGNWKKDAAAELYKKVISLTGRVENSKKLIETLEKLVRLERQAFSIEDASDKSAGYESLLARIAGARA